MSFTERFPRFDEKALPLQVLLAKLEKEKYINDIYFSNRYLKKTFKGITRMSS